MQPEARVKKAIKKFMDEIFPAAWSYMPVQSGYGQHGIPDHIFCVPVTITASMVGATVGLFVGVEAKTKVGKMSDLQRMQREKITAAHGLYYTVYGSADIENQLGILRTLADVRTP